MLRAISAGWNFDLNGFEVDIMISDPTISHIHWQRKRFEILKANQMTRIDDRFIKVEGGVEQLQGQMSNVLNRLDHIEKQIEISEDERLVMAHQLTRSH